MLVDPCALRERMVRVRGLELCVCEWGPEDGPLVLILHGWLDQGAAWNRVAMELAAAGYWVVAPDQRRHGRSAHTPAGTSYHFAEYLGDLDALLVELDRPLQLLVGHSMGGTVASLYAGLRPEAVPRLVLVEGVGPPPETVESAVDRMRTWLDHQKKDWNTRPMDSVGAAAERLRRFNPGLSTGDAMMLAERSTCEKDGAVYWTWDPLHRSRSATAYDSARHRACMSRITATVRFIHGDQSWYMQIPDLEERLASIPRLVERVELTSGHAVHVDAPEALAQALQTAASEQ